MKLQTILLSLIVFSCSHKQKNEITIKGDVPGIPDGPVYIVNAYYWQTPIYTTTASKGHFEFHIIPDSSFYPFLAGIKFPDKGSENGRSGLYFPNNGSDGFFIEPGVITITPDPSKKTEKFPNGYISIPATVKAGKQNEAYKEKPMFGGISMTHDKKREATFSYYEKVIRKYPYSYNLLELIFDSRSYYSEDELTHLLSMFDKDVQRSALGDKIRNYLAIRPDPGQGVENITVLDENRLPGQLITSNSKIKMIIFWSSWCLPCRQEIPTLKALYQKYGNDDRFSMCSISIDTSYHAWKKALDFEKMPWRQAAIIPSETDLVMTKYNFQAIPLIVFVNSEGKEVKRLIGFEENEKEQLLADVNNLINK